jgi:hypothetical protein
VAAVAAEGFKLYSGFESGIHLVKRLDDGSELVEMVLVLSPLRPQVRVRVEIHTAGVLFEDGTTVREFTAADFNELGQAQVRFVRPTSTKTSVCHRTKAYQGPAFLGLYP